MGLFFSLQGVKNIVNSSLLINVCGSTHVVLPTYLMSPLNCPQTINTKECTYSY